MERLMYRFEGTTVKELQDFRTALDSKENQLLSLRELLRSNAESARGIFLLDFPEESVPALIRYAVNANLSIPMFCSHSYQGETLHLLRRAKLLSVFPTASLLEKLANGNGETILKAQAVYLDLPWRKGFGELFRISHTRVVITSDPGALPLIAAEGYFGIPAVKAGETYRSLRSLELPIQKLPLFTSPFLAPRVAMLKGTDELLSCTFRRSYHPSTDRYRLQAVFPSLSEMERPFPANPSAAFTKALEENYGILLKLGSEELFVYGIHGDTGCFLTFNASWTPRLLTRQRLESDSSGDTHVTLLKHTGGQPKPRGEIFAAALYEQETDDADLLTGRTAAVQYLNAFCSSEEERDPLSLQIFLEERLLIGKGLEWFASAEDLYIDHLEAHLSALEKKIRPVLQRIRNGDRTVTPSRRLQWGDAMQNCFASEEICLRECVEDRKRLATYRRWAKELRKKS